MGRTCPPAISDGLSCHRRGKVENVCGWYHSHPGYGCWLSGIDVQTQMTQLGWSFDSLFRHGFTSFSL
jgi:proteasome lid subunit RPN8/RPN11